MKNKDKRHKRDVGKKMFSRKLGGTHQKNDQKNNKSHKNKPVIKTNKVKKEKKIKPSKTSE